MTIYVNCGTINILSDNLIKFTHIIATSKFEVQHRRFTMFKLKPECLYAKWDGISDFCGGTTTGLQKSRIYKFLLGTIQDHSTYVKVLDMETRQILPYKYNMVLFTALNKYSGSVSTRPVVGQCSRIIFEEKNLKHYCNTSPILYINAISKNVYDIITNDSVYTVTVI